MAMAVSPDGGLFADTWRWDGTRWERIATGGPSGPADALERGADLPDPEGLLSGSGKRGQVLKEDVLAAMSKPAAAPSAVATGSAVVLTKVTPRLTVRKGETINWSNVPSSRSRATDCEVIARPATEVMIATSEGSVNQI